MAFAFEVVATDGNARAGILHTPHGDIPTPCFAPVGTLATVKALPPRDLDELGISLILANTYHLTLRPGESIVKAMGGLHAFMQWNKPILTDSGGFQVFSLTEINRIDDEGVTFRSHIDGAIIRLTPEKSMQIQQDLGADIIMCFDQCPPPTERATVEAAIKRTHDWALRCREAHPDDDKQALFGIVQGGIFPDLREQSARFLQERVGFKGYAIGGLAVGETKPEMYQTLDHTLPFLPVDKPRYLMGVGDPDDLCHAITRGVDLFDCVMPTRIARHGAALTWDGRISMRNQRYREDPRPLMENSGCYTDNFSRAYLRHLVVTKELLGHYLLSLHNVNFLIQHVRNMRQAIIEGRLADYTQQFLARYLRSNAAVEP